LPPAAEPPVAFGAAAVLRPATTNVANNSQTHRRVYRARCGVGHLQPRGEDWLAAPPTSATFGLKRPEVIALWETKSAPHPLVTLTQPLRLTGGIGCVRQKMYILGTAPARFTRFYDKVKNNPGWTVHTLPCTIFMQLEMPDELTAILLQAIP
jgi:hypothetical protein